MPRGRPRRGPPRPLRSSLPTIEAWQLVDKGAIDLTTRSVEAFPHHWVEVTHSRFPNGGWRAFLVCTCGRRCRTLRLMDEQVVCRQCDGLPAKGDRAAAIARQRARVYEMAVNAPIKAEIRLRRMIIAERKAKLRGAPT